jgi:hypothetical protein
MGTNSNHPSLKTGRSLISKHTENYLHSLPYDHFREALVCGHSPNYIVKLYENQPWFCGLCFFREGTEGEVPTRIHQYKTLADNGNPETTPKMISHMHVTMGLKPPEQGEALSDFRKRRSALAREQYTTRNPFDHSKIVQQYKLEPFSRPAPGLFPVTTALWRLMGYQPPLGRVLVLGVGGRTETDIAGMLSASVLDVYIRMAKAIRVAMGFIPDDGTTGSRTSPRERGAGRPEEAGSDE